MDAMFQDHHPKNSLLKGKGLFQEFFGKLKKRFPLYKDQVLLLVTKMLTRFRTRTINRLMRLKKQKERQRKTAEFKKQQKLDAQKNKKSRTRAPVTDRGIVKLGRRTLPM